MSSGFGKERKATQHTVLLVHMMEGEDKEKLHR